MRKRLAVVLVVIGVGMLAASAAGAANQHRWHMMPSIHEYKFLHAR